MVNDLGGGEVGHGHSTHLSSQVEPQQALSEVQSGVLQSLLRKLREQMEHAVNIRVNQVPWRAYEDKETDNLERLDSYPCTNCPPSRWSHLVKNY